MNAESGFHAERYAYETDDHAGSKFAAIFMAGLLNFCWLAFVIWYTKAPDSLLCSKEQGGFPIFPPCPEPRQAAGFVGIVGSAVGFTISSLVAARVGKLSTGGGFGASALSIGLLAVIAFVGFAIVVG